MYTTLSSKGQITEIRSALRLNAGDRVDFVVFVLEEE